MTAHLVRKQCVGKCCESAAISPARTIKRAAAAQEEAAAHEEQQRKRKEKQSVKAHQEGPKFLISYFGPTCKQQLCFRGMWNLSAQADHTELQLQVNTAVLEVDSHSCVSSHSYVSDI